MKGSEPGNLALVLSGGGARAAYQVGVLKAVAEMAPDLKIPILTGVSAGAINAIFLAAHDGSLEESVRALTDEWSGLTSRKVYSLPPFELFRVVKNWLLNLVAGRSAPATANRGLLNMQPLCEYLSARIRLGMIDEKITRGDLRAVALSTNCYTTGTIVTFVHGADDIRTWRRARRVAVREPLTMDHVMASSAIPLVFPAVQLNGRYFGDGSIRQTAPLAPAIHLGARKVIAISMRARGKAGQISSGIRGEPTALQLMGVLLHSIFLDTLDADAERLERINTILKDLPGDVEPPAGLGVVDLLMLRPSRDLGSMAENVTLDFPPLVTWLLRSMGGQRRGNADFMSYLAFDPGYTSALMDLGYEDSRAQQARILRFLER